RSLILALNEQRKSRTRWRSPSPGTPQLVLLGNGPSLDILGRLSPFLNLLGQQLVDLPLFFLAVVGQFLFHDASSCRVKGRVPATGQTRSTNPCTPACSAQWTQQKICSSFSTPCPITRQPQCSQVGASAW